MSPVREEKSPRVAILFQRFGPYHHARLNAAGQLMSVWGIEACGMEDTYAWDKVEGASAFKRVTLTDRDTNDRVWRRQLHKKMWQALNEIKPQVVVVPGWASVDAFSALLWCAQTHTPSVVMSESTMWDEQRSMAKEWVKRRLVRLNSAGLSGGTPHDEYLHQLGLPRGQIFSGYDAVDNDYFSRHADKARLQADNLRKQFGLPGKYFLASARFVEKKNLLRLMQAYAFYQKQAADSDLWPLVLLGDGPLKSALKKLILELNLESSIILPGFKQYDELPIYFGLAGAFVHASTTEQWGLVVNEAMASGLPVLVSNRCGCAHDLVKDGVNGFTFDPLNVDQLTQLMIKIAAKDFPLGEYGLQSRQIVSEWGPERFANGLFNAIKMALERPRPAVGLLDRSLLNLLIHK